MRDPRPSRRVAQCLLTHMVPTTKETCVRYGVPRTERQATGLSWPTQVELSSLFFRGAVGREESGTEAAPLQKLPRYRGDSGPKRDNSLLWIAGNQETTTRTRDNNKRPPCLTLRSV